MPDVPDEVNSKDWLDGFRDGLDRWDVEGDAANRRFHAYLLAVTLYAPLFPEMVRGSKTPPATMRQKIELGIDEAAGIFHQKVYGAPMPAPKPVQAPSLTPTPKPVVRQVPP